MAQFFDDTSSIKQYEYRENEEGYEDTILENQREARLKEDRRVENDQKKEQL